MKIIKEEHPLKQFPGRCHYNGLKIGKEIEEPCQKSSSERGQEK